MKESQIHPRILERLEQIANEGDEPLTDMQVRIYCKLRKAAAELSEIAPSQLERKDGSPLQVCEDLAKRLRGHATGNRPDLAELKQIYADVESLVERLNQDLRKAK